MSDYAALSTVQPLIVDSNIEIIDHIPTAHVILVNIKLVKSNIYFTVT